jgi:hypothetical protein
VSFTIYIIEFPNQYLQLLVGLTTFSIQNVLQLTPTFVGYQHARVAALQIIDLDHISPAACRLHVGTWCADIEDDT